MKIVKEKKRVTIEEYTHEFVYNFDHGAGFTFPCDKNGKLKSLTKEGRANYNDCINKKVDVIDKGIHHSTRKYTEPAIGVCIRCKRKVALSDFTNTCECGADYNIHGDLLTPRSQWGEETGENF